MIGTVLATLGFVGGRLVNTTAQALTYRVAASTIGAEPSRRNLALANVAGSVLAGAAWLYFRNSFSTTTRTGIDLGLGLNLLDSGSRLVTGASNGYARTDSPALALWRLEHTIRSAILGEQLADTPA